MNIITIIVLFWLHFIGDFLLQSDKMATNKSKSIEWLSLHVVTYIFPFLLFGGPLYGLINFILHWETDFFTSRMTSTLWKNKKVHLFFVVIGLDQAIHMTCLLLTLPFLNLWWLKEFVK